MANEEQRKAFAAYMSSGGSSTASAGQPVPQYPGSVANPASQYLFNVNVRKQFPGLGAPPAAPTPPPAAATSSIVSYQGLQGGFAPQAAFGQASGQQQGQAQGQSQSQNQSQLGGTQFMPAQIAPSGYIRLPHDYANQLVPPGSNVAWQHSNLNALSSASASIVGPMSHVMAPSQLHLASEISRDKRADEHFLYRFQTGEEARPQFEEHTVPVLLCHTCSDCGQMRSAGYHRNHPVIPGKPIVTTPCRKCKKRGNDHRRSRATSYTRVRTCTADEPCDWPREPVHVVIDHSERRGRQRNRDEIYASWRTNHLRSSIIKQSSSRANLGLRSMQRSPLRDYMSTARVRISSLSPGRSRYDGVWPLPDVVGMRPSRQDTPFPVPEELWPPPDVVRTHSYRKQSPHRPRPRIIELSLSPPLARSRTTKFKHREASEERRARSPVRRSESHIRMQSHPQSYRTVAPDNRVHSHSNEALTHDAASGPVSVIKATDMTYEPSFRRRNSLRNSQQSTDVEVGGPRVQFAAERREDSVSNDRPERDKHKKHIRYERRSYVDAPASPPLDRIERLHIRRSSPSPRRAYEEIRVDRARRISPSPLRCYEEVRFRQASVSPRRPQEPSLRPPPSPPPRERTVHRGYRHISRTMFVDHTRSLTPPPNRKRASVDEDETDSEDDGQGRLIEVRSWNGLGENGQPANFVERRRNDRMIDKGSVGGSDFRPLTERLSSRSWREV
ncbi:hypothetical protein SVAN01_02434 [Stagonosporopsis vannaccii]|nr:hypothetical protein SVAN01_02434 [Stagonosporopsis vannaccii]